MKYSDISKKIWEQRTFIVFLVIAILLWFIIQLSKQYTTDIIIPVKVTSGYNEVKWMNDTRFNIKANCSSDGQTILSYKLGMRPTVGINLSELNNIRHTSGNKYTIEIRDFARAIQNHLSSAKINALLDTSYNIFLYDIEEKVIPIKSNIIVSYASQYMSPLGKVKLEYDSITVKASSSILDTLAYIETEQAIYRNVDKQISSSINLIIPENVYPSISKIRFDIDAERFTQYKIDLNIESLQDKDITMIPNYVSAYMNIPINSHINNGQLKAYIEYNPDSGTNRYEVKIKGIPDESEIIAIEPKYINIFKEEK